MKLSSIARHGRITDFGKASTPLSIKYSGWRTYIVDELRYIRCFLSLAETLSFSRTAAELRITQPSVSRQIKMLEAELRVQLFIRSKHQVSLSRDGEQLLNTMRPFYQDMQERFQALRQQSEVIAGELRIGSLTEIGRVLFQQVFRPFQEIYPNITLSIELLKNHEVMQAMQSGSIDFGIVSGEVNHHLFRCYRLIPEESVLVTRSQNPQSFEDLVEVPCVSYRYQDPLLQKFQRMFRTQCKGKRLVERVRINSIPAMIEVLLVEDYWAVLPVLTIEPYLADGRLRETSWGRTSSYLHLLQRESAFTLPKDKAFRQFVLRECRDRGRLGRQSLQEK